MVNTARQHVREQVEERWRFHRQQTYAGKNMRQHDRVRRCRPPSGGERAHRLPRRHTEVITLCPLFRNGGCICIAFFFSCWKRVSRT